MKHLLYRIACIWALIISASPSASAEHKQAIHLILLSGQSNMASMDPDQQEEPSRLI